MPKAILEEKKSLILKKHVGLIHCTNKLSLVERKVSNALLYHAYDNLHTQDEHQIHIPSLCELIGYNSNDVKTIKKALMSLISTVLEWNLVDKELKDNQAVWMASAMLSDAKIDGPVCTYSYSYRMRELCNHPEFYGRLNIAVLSKFKSTYGLALYENCIRYQNISQTPWFDLLTYRKLMGVTQGKYEVFRDLNKRVTKPSVVEVNTHSPILVTPEFRREGRVVTAIRFVIAKNKINVQATAKNQDLIYRLKSHYGCSVEQIELMSKNYSEQYILEKMALIESSSSYQDGKIANLAKYLEKALEKDYQAPKSSFDNVVKTQLTIATKQSDNEEKQKMIRAFRNYQTEKIPALLKAMEEKERKNLLLSFEHHISSTLYHKSFVSNGYNDPLVRDKLIEYIRAEHPTVLGSLMSYAAFSESQEKLSI